MLGVALFGSLLGGADGFIVGARISLAISALLLAGSAALILLGGRATRDAARSL